MGGDEGVEPDALARISQTDQKVFPKSEETGKESHADSAPDAAGGRWRGGTLLLPGSGVPAPAGDDFQLGEWTGESFVLMHAVRDGEWNKPLPPPERRVEVAVVGATSRG